MGEISVKTGNNARNGGKNSLNRLIRLFAGKKSAQIREILISESAWEEMTCLFAPSLKEPLRHFSETFFNSFLALFEYCMPLILSRPFAADLLNLSVYTSNKDFGEKSFLNNFSCARTSIASPYIASRLLRLAPNTSNSSNSYSKIK
ncbi:TPA: hypothetical protein ACN18A_002402 [Klebsiella pneumoniae]